MRALLELLRILCFLIIIGGIGAVILHQAYQGLGTSYTWLGSLGIVLFIFVLYRNKLQFSGWHKSEHSKKLPKRITYLINISAFLLIISPFIFDAIPI